MERRVVITGLGVVAPNGVGLEDFKSALKEGRSGIQFDQQLADRLAILLSGFRNSTH